MIDSTGHSYALRWRFDYLDQRSVFGMWNSPHISAWDKNSDRVVRASIEGKDPETGVTKVMAECDGHVFRNFQWHGVSLVNPNMRGSVTPATTNVGLKILTTTQEVLVLINGQIGKRNLTEDEKALPLATYGR